MLRRESGLQPDATHIASVLGAAGVNHQVEQTAWGVLVRAELHAVPAALESLRSEGYGFLVDVFGADTGERVEVTYHLRSLGRNEDIYVRTALDYGATLPSVWELFPAAMYQEREAAELYGLRLSGHPNPRRLLTVDGSPPYLRKEIAVRTAEEVRAR